MKTTASPTPEFLVAATTKDVVTVEVTFNDTNPRCVSYGKHYTYKVPKAWKVVAGDHLVVQPPDGNYKVVTVEVVHPAPKFDPAAPFTYKWAVSKVPKEEHAARAELDEAKVKALKDLQAAEAAAALLVGLTPAERKILGITLKVTKRPR